MATKKKIRYDLIRPATAEQNERELNGELFRSHQGLYGYTKEHARSRGKLDCPFCGAKNEVYVWSISGGGKRCGGCNALLTSRGAYVPKRVEPKPNRAEHGEEPEEKFYRGSTTWQERHSEGDSDGLDGSED